MIPRTATKTVLELAKGYPVIAITGPRQSGKTTLVRSAFPDKAYVSLEDPDQLEYALSDPRGFLERFPDGAILDEVQRAPSLFSYLQTRVDLDNRQGIFILTGSQQFGLLSKITQTLAGRVGMIQLLPFSLKELQAADKRVNRLEDWLWQGAYPPIYDKRLSPTHWYGNYVTTYLERDVRQIINLKDLNTFQRFIRMCAARAGQLINFSSLGNDCGISNGTVRSWLSVLETSYIIFMVHPHYRNFGKRLVKTPKLYFYDTGLAAWLLGIRDPDHLSIHSNRGPLFESFIISELIKGRFNRGLVSNLFFWRDNIGNEIDVVVEQGEKLIPIELKSGQTLSGDSIKGIVKWMQISGLSSGTPYLVYGGKENQNRSGIQVLSWKNITTLAETI